MTPTPLAAAKDEQTTDTECGRSNGSKTDGIRAGEGQRSSRRRRD
jgi:hypothetical protein